MATEQTQDMSSNSSEHTADFIAGPEYDVCPCCGKPTLPKVPEINKEIMDHFMACMLTGVPFSHNYKLYDGNIVVCVEQLNADEAELVSRALSELSAIEDIPEVADNDINITALKSAIRILCSIKTIEVHSGSAYRMFHPKESVLGSCEKIKSLRGHVNNTLSDDEINTIKELIKDMTSPGNISGMAIKQLLTIVETHNRVYDILMDKGFDKNFWEGIKLA